MSEACWFNRFHPTEPRCDRPGVWKKPEAISDFSRATRWCDEHRHEDDVLVIAGRCESCWREAQLRYAGGQGPYDSLVDAYYAVMNQREAERAPCTQGGAAGARQSVDGLICARALAMTTPKVPEFVERLLRENMHKKMNMSWNEALVFLRAVLRECDFELGYIDASTVEIYHRTTELLRWAESTEETPDAD
jgi:hypothetical protein